MRTGEALGTVGATLARNRLGVASVVFFSVAAAAPLTVVAGAVTTGYAVTGFAGIPAAYVAVAVLLAVFAAGFVAMARYTVNAGAFYSYIARGLGRPAGVASALVALAAYNLMQIGIVGGFGAVASVILRVTAGVTVPWPACSLACWAVIAILGLVRVDLNGRVLAVLLLAEIGIALLYDAVLLAHPAGGHLDVGPLWPDRLLAPGGIAALVGAIASFVGFESTVVFAEETKDARRTVARATYLAIAVTGVLYAVSAWALPVATGDAGVQSEAQRHGTELMFDLALPYVGQSLVDAGHLLFLTSLFAAALAFHNIVARYLFALGRERVLPARLGRASRSGAPRLGSLSQTTITAGAVLVATILHADPAVHLLFWLTVVGGFGVLLLMAATSLSVVVFFHHRRSAGPTDGSGPAWVEGWGGGAERWPVLTGRGDDGPWLVGSPWADRAPRPARAEHGDDAPWPEGWESGESVWRRRVAPAIATVVLLAVAAGTVAQFHILLGVDVASPLRWIFPGSFVVVGLIGLLWSWFLRRRRPDVYRAIGLGANSLTTPSSLARRGIRHG